MSTQRIFEMFEEGLYGPLRCPQSPPGNDPLRARLTCVQPAASALRREWWLAESCALGSLTVVEATVVDGGNRRAGDYCPRWYSGFRPSLRALPLDSRMPWPKPRASSGTFFARTAPGRPQGSEPFPNRNDTSQHNIHKTDSLTLRLRHPINSKGAKRPPAALYLLALEELLFGRK